MRTSPSAVLVVLCLAGAAVGCDKSNPLTVKGRALTVKEQNYGEAQSYCGNLAFDGQYVILLSDYSLCDLAKSDGGARSTFHSDDQTSLMLITPKQKVITPVEFKVGVSNCVDSKAPDDAAAIAWFGHNDPMTGRYDVHVAATGGTVRITSSVKDITALHTVKGTFDLSFGEEKISGSFDALLCAGLFPELIKPELKP